MRKKGEEGRGRGDGKGGEGEEYLAALIGRMGKGASCEAAAARSGYPLDQE